MSARDVILNLPLLRHTAVVLTLGLPAFAQTQTAAPLYAQPQNRILNAVTDGASRFSAPNSVHPAVLAATASAAVDPDLPLRRMVLTLKPDAKQQAALETLQAQLNDPASANFHKFLTPAQFAESFGVSQGDVMKITAWLSSNGFHVDQVASNRRAIVFSGTAGQIAAAFRTEIRQFTVRGERHYANATAPQFPIAFAGVVQGFLKLNDFHSKPTAHASSLKAVPLNTSGGNHYLAPADYGVIYNSNPLLSSGIDGTAQSITVIGRSNVNASDIASFRSSYALPAPNLATIFATGIDPGFTNDNDSIEATLDVEWAGAVAPNAGVKLVIAPNSVTTDGLDLAAQYAVTNNVSSILSVSFGICEASANNSFYASLWQQAAVQGISVLVAAGDSGAADCDSSDSSTGSIRAVNGICSTPYNTCVGGTMFDDTANPGQYWLPGNNAGLGSAISYIPELVWNESGTTLGGQFLLAGGGGASGLYSKPYWQSGPGVPVDSHRDVPDVSLAAAQHDGYLLFYNGAVSSVGGTSAATPAFAGIMALVTQKNGQSQGNINQTLYPLAALASGSPIFHDVTAGNNSVPGVTGYAATARYDVASGLGSVDATQLANNWTIATNQFSFTASATAVTATPAQSSTVTLTALDSGSFHSTLTLAVVGLPVGVTARFTPSTIVGSGSTVLTLAISGWANSGTSNVTVSATGGGLTHTVVVALTLIVTPGCTLVATPASVAVFVSQATSVKVSCGNLQGGFSGNLALTVSGAPANVTASFSPASIAAGSGISTLTVNATSAAVPGSYSLLVTATLPGSSPLYSTTLAVPLNVSAAATFKITTSTPSVSLAQGTSATVTLTSLHSGGFNSSISLIGSGMPSGVTASMSPASFAAPGDGTSTITFQSTSIAVPGTYTLLVTALGGNLSLRVPITVQITAAPAYTLSSTAVLTLRQSATASVNVVTSNPVNNFNLPVNLTIGGLPSGVTAAFSPSSIAAPGIGTSVLTLTASATATTGVSTITLTATGGNILRYYNIRLTVTPQPTFALSVSLPNYNMIAGGTLTESISATGVNGYTANIQLSTMTLPAGFSAIFANSTISGSYGKTTLTIQPAASVTPGSYVITVVGTDPATSLAHSATVTLLVGNVSVTASTPSVSIGPTGSASVLITVTASSFTGNVALSLAGLPAGASYSLSSVTLVGSGTSTLTISSIYSVHPGTYVLSVRAMAGGVMSTTPLTLVII